MQFAHTQKMNKYLLVKRNHINYLIKKNLFLIYKTINSLSNLSVQLKYNKGQFQMDLGGGNLRGFSTCDANIG